MAVRINSFGVWDYVVFVAMLLVSMGIGVYFAVVGRKQNNQGEYLMAGRSMSIIPVAISILVSFMSAILILGTPAEMYTQGMIYSFIVLGMCLGILMAALFFVPLLYPLKVTSAFEYLEMRFNSRAARLTGTALMILSQVIYMGIASYAPSTALQAVTGFPVWATILIIGVVATFYTSIGGMKAVVWSDVFQSLVMVAGVLAIVIQGSIKTGGMKKVWEINEEWDRVNFNQFSPDPTIRHTFWGLLIGAALSWVGTFGINQASVQRYCSLPTMRKAQLSVLMNIVGIIFLVLITCLSGVVVFAYYVQQDCDPLGRELIDNPNQIIPFFVMDTLSYPAIPGIFISSLFSGALSSVSSSLNALAAITWEDILKPKLDTKISEAQKTLLTKLLVLVFGGLAIGMSFISQNLEGTVLQAAISLIGSAGAPLMGMFVLGAFFPWANAKGAICGAVCGLAISLWFSIGSYVAGIPSDKFPFPNGTCSAYLPDDVMADGVTTTTAAMTSAMTSAAFTTASPAPSSDEKTGLDKMYTISYLWFTPIGIISTVVIGLIASFITGANSIHDVPLKYQVPVASRILCCLPQSWIRTLQCNRDFPDPETIRSEEKDMEFDVLPPDIHVMKDKEVEFDNKAFEHEDKAEEPKQYTDDPPAYNTAVQ